MFKNAANVGCALLVSLLLASPAAAAEVVGTWRMNETAWFYLTPPPYDPTIVNPGLYVGVNFGEGTAIQPPNSSFSFTIPALPVGQVSRHDGINLSGLEPNPSMWFWNYLDGIGYTHGGFHPVSPVGPISYLDLRRATTLELEFLTWNVEVENADGDLYYRAYVKYEVRLLDATVPEPAGLTLALVAACGLTLNRRRHQSVSCTKAV